jgi:hypothetical protein
MRGICPEFASSASDASGKNHYPHTRVRAHGDNRKNVTHLTHPTQIEELEDIPRMVSRLLPDRRDPEAFHLAKSEAVGRLWRLIRKIRTDFPRVGGG